MDILVKNHFLALFADQEPARAALLLPLAFSDSNGFVQETGTDGNPKNSIQTSNPKRKEAPKSSKIHRLFAMVGPWEVPWRSHWPSPARSPSPPGQLWASRSRSKESGAAASCHGSHVTMAATNGILLRREYLTFQTNSAHPETIS